MDRVFTQNEKMSALKMLTDKSTGKRPRRRPRDRWEKILNKYLPIRRIVLIRLSIIGEPL